MAGSEFSEDQFSNIYPDGIENHYWNHSRNNIILNFLKKSGLVNEPVLEIGGGRGIVAKFLHDKGVDITSVELANSVPVKGTEGYFKPGTNAFELPYELRSRITMILLLDVIEHIEEPGKFIEEIIIFFPGMKYLLITVPARQELWTNYDVYNGHFKRYSLKDIRVLKAGQIRLTTGSYLFHILYPVFYLYSKVIRSRQTEIAAPIGWKIILHRIISIFLQVDFILIPSKAWGTSIIAIFNKIP